MSARHLPIDNSFIPFDLLFKVGLAYIDNDQLTLKSLFAGLPHSEMGMRYHLRRLLVGGWVELHSSDADRRSKLIRPSQKLLDQLALLESELMVLVQQHLTTERNILLADLKGL